MTAQEPRLELEPSVSGVGLDSGRAEPERRLAYIVSRFPALSETFILRELEELRRRGWKISLIPLLRQPGTVRHAESAWWESRAWFTPFVSGAILQANLRALARRPRTYLGLWREVLGGTWRDPNYLVGALGVFPKSVYLAERVSEAGIRHVHAHYLSHPAVAALIIGRLAGAGFSATAHAHDIYVSQEMLATKVRWARFVATISEFNRAFLARFAGLESATKIQVVRCGVDLEAYPPSPMPPSGPFRIVAVGSLQPYKGHTYLVQACQLLKRRGLDFRCRIIGDGELRGRLQAEIVGMGLEERVRLVGPRAQDEVAAELAGAHVLALPSVIQANGKMEGIPVVVMEALASGRAVVASRISGIPELVRHEETGLLVEPGRPEALADALERLARDRPLAERLAAAGRGLVEREFNLGINVQKLEGLLSAAVAGRRRSEGKHE